MSSEERKKVLQMVSDGKISADEAARLMRALDESAGDEVEVIGPASGFESEKMGAEQFERIRTRATRWAMLPLWSGILVMVLSAWGMYSALQSSGYGFWFFCLSMPLFLGILLIALGAGGLRSRWVYVNVDRTQAQDWPKNITIALPIPLGLVSWFIKTFGGRIEGLKKTTVDELLMAIHLTRSIKEPLIINVDEGDNGERVQVFIG